MNVSRKTLILSLFIVSLLSMGSINNVKPLSTASTTQKGQEISEKPFVKVALLLDTSNSMDGLIEQAKSQLWEIVNELSYARFRNTVPNIQIALYEYGNDGLNEEKGFVRQILPFSSDLDEISKQLFSLTTNGGSEYCGQVINTALKQLDWGNNPNDLKLIFIAGNEPYTQGPINYKLASKNAHDKDITVNTIFCGDYHQGIDTYWKAGADLTHGDYMAINHNYVTVHIPSPYDDKILRLNQDLNRTYVTYGSSGYASMQTQREQDKNAQKYSKANAVSRAVSKSSHIYKNKSWDLVDAEENESFSYETLKEEELPAELKGKSKSDIKAYISKKRKERISIQDQIQELNNQRKTYIAKHQKNSNNELENALLIAIKKQAIKKGYSWQ